MSLEALSLDGLSLNDGTTYRLHRELSVPPPPKRLLWIARRDGDALGDLPGHERREVTALVRVWDATTMDEALESIGAILDKLQKAERSEQGIPLTWTPAGSAVTVTMYVLAGEITDLPVTPTGEDAGWFKSRPLITVKLYCKPFLYGDAVAESVVTNTDPLQEVTISDIPGDVPAEGRIVVTDDDSQPRDHVEWGLHAGSSAETATDLILDSDSLSTTGFTGSGTTRSGAYDPGASGNSVIRGTTSPYWVGLCGTGDQEHVGTYRVKARVWTDATDAQARLAYRIGESSLTRNTAVGITVSENFTEIDLGLVDIPKAAAGSQQWDARLEFMADTYGMTFDLDTLYLIPAERAGKARISGAQADTPTTLTGLDGFSQTAGALAGKTAVIGGNWSGAGDSDDFAVEATDHTAYRAASSDASDAAARFALLGSAVTDCAVSCRVKFTSGGLDPVTSSDAVAFGVLARYVDTTHWLALVLTAVPAGSDPSVLPKVALWRDNGSGHAQINASHPSALYGVGGTYYTLTLIVDSVGRYRAYAEINGASTGLLFSGHSSLLATGGALASGKVGLYDVNTIAPSSAIIRNYDDFATWTPESDAVIFTDQSIEFRSDDTLREDAAGLVYGRPSIYRGSRVFIPQAGDEGKVARVAVKARRNDVDLLPDDHIADSTSVEVEYTPRYLAVPREA